MFDYHQMSHSPLKIGQKPVQSHLSPSRGCEPHSWSSSFGHRAWWRGSCGQISMCNKENRDGNNDNDGGNKKHTETYFEQASWHQTKWTTMVHINWVQIFIAAGISCHCVGVVAVSDDSVPFSNFCVTKWCCSLKVAVLHAGWKIFSFSFSECGRRCHSGPMSSPPDDVSKN